MGKIAIDIALFLSENLADYTVEVSKKQAKKYNDKILLNKENCLPHISLAMGVIDEDRILEIKKILEEIAAQFSALNLVVEEYRSYKIPPGETASEFVIGKTSGLQALHEAIMNKIGPLLSYNASIGMVYSPPVVDELTLFWINNYFKNSSFENFKPHITIGFGKIDSVATPIFFTVSKLAICHLGNFCTCRKILAFVEL